MPKLNDVAIESLWEHLNFKLKGDADRDMFNQAVALYDPLLVIDLHLDTLLQTCFFDYDLLERHELDWEPRLGRGRAIDRIFELFEKGQHRPRINHSDVPRMIEGGMSGAVFGVHWWPRNAFRMTDPYDGIARQFATLNRAAADAPNKLRRVHDPAALLQAHADGVIAAMTGVEGISCIGKDLNHNQQQRLDRIGELRQTHGTAYLTLNHHTKSDASHNSWSMLPWDRDAKRTSEIPLTDYGRRVVQTCNDVGMIIDLSHTNRGGIIETCKISSKPVIASHSGLHGATGPIPDRFTGRLLDEDSALAIAKTGGVIGLALCPEFFSDPDQNPDFTSMRTVAQQAVALIDLINRETGENKGEEAIALGGDLDGWIPSIPVEMDDVSHLPLLAYFLLEAGLGDKAIRGFFGDNFLRVWELVTSGV